MNINWLNYPALCSNNSALSLQLEEGLCVKEDGDGKEEPDFIETHCHWKDCDREYGTQEDLVKVNHKLALLIKLIKFSIASQVRCSKIGRSMGN